MEKTKVVIVGGTGYLGQHLLQAFAGKNSVDRYDVAFTHHSSPLPCLLLEAFPHFPAFPVDLKTGLGFHSISQDFVYEGVKSFYKEEDETLAVNVYGKLKVASELLIRDKYQNFAILRSSIIVGPQTVLPLPKNLPIQWMDSVLQKGDTVDFIHDEYRCPIYVKDLVSITLKFIDTWVLSDDKHMRLVLNAGGPDRLSRVQMAEVVAEVRGHNLSLIKHVSASSVDRGVASPADISMDITKLIQTLQISPTSFKDGVRLTLQSESHSHILT